MTQPSITAQTLRDAGVPEQAIEAALKVIGQESPTWQQSALDDLVRSVLPDPAWSVRDGCRWREVALLIDPEARFPRFGFRIIRDSELPACIIWFDTVPEDEPEAVMKAVQEALTNQTEIRAGEEEGVKIVRVRLRDVKCGGCGKVIRDADPEMWERDGEGFGGMCSECSSAIDAGISEAERQEELAAERYHSGFPLIVG